MDAAAIELADDYLNGPKAAAAIGDRDLSSFVPAAMLQKYEAAEKDRRVMCGETGGSRRYVKMGHETRSAGWQVALRRATADRANGVLLHPNWAHPLCRTDRDNNMGIGAPEMDDGNEHGGERSDLLPVHESSLFGTDRRRLFPSDGIEGITHFDLSSRRAVAHGLPGGEAECCTDPDRFTHRQGRETVEWAPEAEEEPSWSPASSSSRPCSCIRTARRSASATSSVSAGRSAPRGGPSTVAKNSA